MDARLRAGEEEIHGLGRVERNPRAPYVPQLGEELAAARALSDLRRQLAAAADTGDFLRRFLVSPRR